LVIGVRTFYYTTAVPKRSTLSPFCHHPGLNRASSCCWPPRLVTR
jgi:hypothetical protein